MEELLCIYLCKMENVGKKIYIYIYTLFFNKSTKRVNLCFRSVSLGLVPFSLSDPSLEPRQGRVLSSAAPVAHRARLRKTIPALRALSGVPRKTRWGGGGGKGERRCARAGKGGPPPPGAEAARERTEGEGRAWGRARARGGATAFYEWAHMTSGGAGGEVPLIANPAGPSERRANRSASAA